MSKPTEEDVLLQDITEDERAAALEEFRQRQELPVDATELVDH
jgi:hypothetical protein